MYTMYTIHVSCTNCILYVHCTCIITLGVSCRWSSVVTARLWLCSSEEIQSWKCKKIQWKWNICIWTKNMRDVTCRIRASLAASSSSNSFLRFSSTFISVSVVTNCLERIFSVLIWTQNHKKRWLREGPKKIVFFGTLSQTSDPTHPPCTFGTPLSEKWKFSLFCFLGCLEHFIFFLKKWEIFRTKFQNLWGLKASWNGQIWPPHLCITCFRTFLDVCSKNNWMVIFTKKFRTPTYP